MSVPPPFTQTQQRGSTSNEGVSSEDCRDYLRTGRCKYGASCKYKHPSNVQTGGGMKAPIDPSEPLFPVRPNEPICQYYMKHGTCKFGQTCKFNHPPQVDGTGGVMNGTCTVVLSMPNSRTNDDVQTMWNPGNDSSGFQILPQRPDEPNCIYFLKNGRCKYGATCRYHHPLNFHHDRRLDDGRRQHMAPAAAGAQDQRNASKVHYLTAFPPGTLQQGHFVVSDGGVTFLAIDGASSGTAHVLSIPQSTSSGMKDVPVLYTAAGTLASSSSSTSIASSYETAISNLDAQDSSSSLWNRKAAGNGNNGYTISDGSAGRSHIVQGGRTIVVQNLGDPALGLPRVVSTGSASDASTIYYDSAGPPPTMWRGTRSASFDHTRSRAPMLQSQDEELRRSSSVHAALNESVYTAARPRSLSTTSPVSRGSQPQHQGMRQHRQPGEVDDGLSMMTSALLTMLDTPEDAAANQSHGYEYDDQREVSTPRMGTRYSSSARGPSALLEESTDYHRRQHQHHQQQDQQQLQQLNQQQQNHQYTQPPMSFSQQQLYLGPQSNDNQVEGSLFSTRGFLDSLQENSHGQVKENQSNWMPSWQGSAIPGAIHENSQSLLAMPAQPSTSPHHSSTHHQHNVGLYLP
jgi:hypothetical protein